MENETIEAQQAVARAAETIKKHSENITYIVSDALSGPYGLVDRELKEIRDDVRYIKQHLQHILNQLEDC